MAERAIDTVKVLVVDDDPEVAETVQMAFSLRWPESVVVRIGTGHSALQAVLHSSLDIVVLDVILPDTDGFAVLRGIRAMSRVPVIMLTVRASEADKVRGLELGADDYVAKPFSPFELVARAAAVLRRSPSRDRVGPPGRRVWAGHLKLELDEAQVFVGEREVHLTPIEFGILSLLVRNANKLVTRDAIIEAVWGMDPVSVKSYLVKPHVQHLRDKLGEHGVDRDFIVSVRGLGYKVPE